MSDVNVVRKRAGIILSDGINKYFLSFLCVFMASVRELNCHTVYADHFAFLFLFILLIILF
jgi:hypothetical protein